MKIYALGFLTEKGFAFLPERVFPIPEIDHIPAQPLGFLSLMDVFLILESRVILFTMKREAKREERQRIKDVFLKGRRKKRYS